jgi:hypothetical protein
MRGTYKSKFEKVICKECYELDKYVLIVKTQVKQGYLLKQDDLVGLNEYYGKCVFRNRQSTYYIKEQVIEKACIVHNTTPDELRFVLDNILREKQIEKENKKIKSNNNKQIKKNKRKEKLVKVLNDAGVTFRNDSVLCEKYINDDTNYTLDECVNRMCEMKYLFEYCHMNDCKQKAYEKHCDEIKAGYYPDCSVFDRAEHIALTEYSNGKYPEVFPWQT